ncbi:hypothetical protein DSAG12_02488 [Promethearchaeum syntrophicum]|uniref:Uncharacterized protein n=1 Tax=Promethearchaeum syntrophicum TaxID=2594042 RepID=A0A5B9DBU0_9ARCH|nr:hypothetical protein [Candidatus Prometheoarchaeum syntrophicum]QEE16658.1 hypothetical protein DSAG12_02488 [Candidatus Prometheoarchaeum syntrophicum]
MEPSPYVIIDNNHNVKRFGEYSGGILTKLNGSTNSLIFSEKLALSEDLYVCNGLHVWFENGIIHSKEKESVITDFSEIDYCIQLEPDLIKDFDSARFSAHYPHIVRFLHTACLYLDTESFKIDHLEFVSGEILNRPVGIGHDNGIILGDRLVIDDRRLIFYDCILIGREENQMLKQSYEHFLTIPLKFLSSLILLGNENF